MRSYSTLHGFGSWILQAIGGRFVLEIRERF